MKIGWKMNPKYTPSKQQRLCIHWLCFICFFNLFQQKLFQPKLKPKLNWIQLSRWWWCWCWTCVFINDYLFVTLTTTTHFGWAKDRTVLSIIGLFFQSLNSSVRTSLSQFFFFSFFFFLFIINICYDFSIMLSY